MKNTMKKLLSLLLVAVLLSTATAFSTDTIHSTAATTYPSNQTLVYDIEILEGKYGIIGISGLLDFLSSCSFFEFYSGDQCIASNASFNDFPYYSSHCITKVVFKIDAPYNPNNPTGFRGDLAIKFDIAVEKHSNISTNFDVFIKDLDSQPNLYTYTKEIPLSAYNGIVQTSPVFPAGYNRNNDKYSFENPSEKVPANIYSIVYGPLKGNFLALADSFGGPGLCYGMATTTAALLQNRNTINSFVSSYSNLTIGEIVALLPEYKSNELNMDLLTFIKYGQAAQFASNREANNGNLRGLYSAIKSYISGTGSPVIISVWQKDYKNGHAILATGIRETEDAYMIQIDDSNFALLTPELVISKDFSTWNYTVDGKRFSDGSSYSYSSANGIICYDTDGNTVYHLGKIAGQLTSYDYLKHSFILVVSSSAVAQNNTLTQVFATNNATSVSDQLYNIYWLDEDLHSVQLSTECNDTELTVSDVYSSVSIILDENETADFYIADEDENSVAYYSDKNNNAVISFVTSDEQGEKVTTTISGTTNGGEVSASETVQGINVSGLNDLFISVSTNQGTVTTTAKETTGSAVNIIFNSVENTVKTDWLCQHTDADQNMLCDICGEAVTSPNAPDNNCSCLCHSKNGFMQFVYKLIRFIWQLFGMNMDCACGAKHFDSYFFA